LNLNQWKLFVELIEEEQTNTLSVAEALKYFTKDIKSEPDTLSSSPRSFSSEENKPRYYSFENPLFLEPSTYFGPEKKPLSSEDQRLILVQLSCSTQGTISISTSPVLLTPSVTDLTPHVGRIIYSDVIKVNINKA
jgi:hypothetical protein